MNAPKKGDRVRVEFEAVVNGTSFNSAVPDMRRTVWLDTAETSGGNYSVPLTACTVLAPPVKVGDAVTAANMEQLPLSTVVAFPHGGLVLERWSNVGVGSDWRSTSGLSTPSDAVVGAVILRIGGGS